MTSNERLVDKIRTGKIRISCDPTDLVSYGEYDINSPIINYPIALRNLREVCTESNSGLNPILHTMKNKKKVIRPATLEENLIMAVNYFHTLTNADGSARTEEQRAGLFQVPLSSCSAIKYNYDDSHNGKYNIKLIPISEDLLTLDKACINLANYGLHLSDKGKTKVQHTSDPNEIEISALPSFFSERVWEALIKDPKYLEEFREIVQLLRPDFAKFLMGFDYKTPEILEYGGLDYPHLNPLSFNGMSSPSQILCGKDWLISRTQFAQISKVFYYNGGFRTPKEIRKNIR